MFSGTRVVYWKHIGKDSMGLDNAARAGARRSLNNGHSHEMWWLVGLPPRPEVIAPGSLRCLWLASGLSKPPTKRSRSRRTFMRGRGSEESSGGRQRPASMSACKRSASADHNLSKEVDKFFWIPCCAPAKVCGLSRARLFHTYFLQLCLSSWGCCGDKGLLLRIDWTVSRNASCCNSSKALAAGPSCAGRVAPTIWVKCWWSPEACKACWSKRMALLCKQNSGSNEGGAKIVKIAIGEAQ